MAESAALLVDEVFPEQPVRQWVLSVPYPLRFLFASRPEVMGAVLAIVYRVVATYLARQAGFGAKRARTGAVTLIQRLGVRSTSTCTSTACSSTGYRSSAPTAHSRCAG
jgi:hypothetical protein